MVGHVIELANDEMIPADCIVIYSDNELGQCYISTETLDGERNLKPKFATRHIQKTLTKDLKDII